MRHEKWKSIYIETPRDKSVCVTRIKGRCGYASGTIFDAETKTFRTYEDKENRFVITIWKHDEWYYKKENH